MNNTPKQLPDKGCRLIVDGYLIAIFKHTTILDYTLEGNVSKVIAWDANSQSPAEVEFFADVYIKHDGCSNINFYGENYKQRKDKTACEYHLCGARNYMEFMIILRWIYAIMVHYIGEDKVMEKEEYKNLSKIDFGCDIKYIFD